MKRIALLAGLALASLAAPALAQGYQTGGGLPNTVYGEERISPSESWGISDQGFAAFVVSSDNRAGALVYCMGEYRVLTLALLRGSSGLDDFLDTGERNDALSSLQRNFADGRVVALDRSGRTLATIPLVLRRAQPSGQRPSGGTIIEARLTASQVAAIRSADRLEARGASWTARFTGSGSTWALNQLTNCPMHWLW